MARLFLIAVFCAVLVGCSYGRKHLGCFKDDNNRLFDKKIYQGNELTTEKCVYMCSIAGYRYAGTQNANQCFCGNRLNSAYELKSNGDCSKSCSGDSSQKCGGFWRMSVYSANLYEGCYVDKNTRILSSSKKTSGPMTTQTCLNYCKGLNYKLAGTQYGGQCFCDNYFKQKYDKKPDSECDYNCSGSKGEKCGGFWRISVYLVD